MIQKVLRLLILITSLIGLLTLDSWSQLNAVPEHTEHITIDQNLAGLVKTFVETTSPEQAEEVLVRIQQTPNATVERLSEIIRELPRYTTQPVGTQPRRPITVRGSASDYALYVPEQYDPAQAYPLILCLHGAGFTGEAYLDRWIPRLDGKYILACPSVSMGSWWTRYGEELVLQVLRDVQSHYHINPDRIFLTGMSNGGIGAWIIGMHHADRFAGIAPMASGIDDVLYPFLENLVHTPVYVIHGAEDRIMPVQLSRDLVGEMERRGIPYHYQEHTWTHPHAGGHFFPRQALPDLIDWFDGQRRHALPRTISMVRDATHLTSFYWLRIDMTQQIAAFTENLIDGRDEFISGAIYAKLHAEIKAPNTIVVSTNRIKRYTIFLNQDVVDFSKPLVVETNGMTSFEGMVEPDIKTLLHEVRHRPDRDFLFTAKITIDVIPTGRTQEK